MSIGVVFSINCRYSNRERWDQRVAKRMKRNKSLAIYFFFYFRKYTSGFSSFNWVLWVSNFGLENSIEIGTLLIKFIILPSSSTFDPPEKETPVCTLKNFPYQIQHTIQWATSVWDWFIILLCNIVQISLDNLYITNKFVIIQYLFFLEICRLFYFIRRNC